jgi:hypothetical protein
MSDEDDPLDADDQFIKSTNLPCQSITNKLAIYTFGNAAVAIVATVVK